MPKYVPPYAAAAELRQAKTLRENLHNTTMAVDSILNFSLKPAPPLVTDLSPKEKATNYFADTICEFSEQLTHEELYQALVDAMEGHYQYTKKEFDHATKLRELISGI
jgi:hypothetical protein